MKLFFREYNKTTNAPESRDMRESKRLGKYTPIMDIIERFDC